MKSISKKRAQAIIRTELQRRATAGPHTDAGAKAEVITIEAVACEGPYEANVGEPISIMAGIEYPEHGTGRSAPLATCSHCKGKPLIIRRCPRGAEPPTFCGVCQKCGFHHRVGKAYITTEENAEPETQDHQSPALKMLFKRMTDAEKHIREIRKER